MDQSTLTLAGYVPTRDEYDRALKVVRALTERVEVLTSELRTQAETSAAQMRELAAARERISKLLGDMDDDKIMVAALLKKLDERTAERDAARAEVARLTAALESVRGDVANNERHLDIVEYINAALRGATAPAGCPECHGTRRVDTELGRIICPMCKGGCTCGSVVGQAIDGNCPIHGDHDTAKASS